MRLSILMLLLISCTMGSQATPRYLIMPLELERMESGGGDNALPAYSNHYLNSGKNLVNVNNPGTRDTLNSFTTEARHTYRSDRKPNSQAITMQHVGSAPAHETPSCMYKAKWNKTALTKEEPVQIHTNTTQQEYNAGFSWEKVPNLGWWITVLAFFTILALLQRFFS